MASRRKIVVCVLALISWKETCSELDGVLAGASTDIGRFSVNQKLHNDGTLSFSKLFRDQKTSKIGTEDNSNNSTDISNHRILSRRFYDDGIPLKFSSSADNIWYKGPADGYSRRNETWRKINQSINWPTWSSSKKETHNNRNRKNRKHADLFDDYLGLESRFHELSDRKHIHEHEGFFFPIHVPSHHHHEKEDHLLIPLLLLILIPLLLFAIIIPLNANLLSTLFLIMQNNSASVSPVHLASGRRRKRDLYTLQHPLLEEQVVDMLRILDRVIQGIGDSDY